MKTRLVLILSGILAACIFLEANETRLYVIEGVMALFLLLAIFFRRKLRRLLGTES